MPVLIAVFFLVTVPALSFFLRETFAVSFPHRGLILSVLVSWVVLATSRTWYADQLLTIQYGSASIPLTNLGLKFDWVSWSFSTAVITILLVYTLTKGRASVSTAGLMAVSGVGIVSLFSANNMTFLLSWILFDVIWLTAAFQDSTSPLRRKETMTPYLVLLAGPIFLLTGSFLSLPGAELLVPGRGEQLPSFFLGAAGFCRLAILYFAPRSSLGQEGSSGTWWLLSLGPISLGLLLITRSAQLAGYFPPAGLKVIFSLMILVTGLTAFIIKDKHIFRKWWTLGVFFSALQGVIFQQPELSAAWGIAYLVPGSLLYLTDRRGGGSRFPLAAAAVGFLGLPYTPLSINGLISAAQGSGWLAGLSAGVLAAAFLKQLLADSPESRKLTGGDALFTGAVSFSLIGIQYLLTILGMRSGSILSWKGELILFLPGVCAVGLVWLTSRTGFNFQPVIDFFDTAVGVLEFLNRVIQFWMRLLNWIVRMVTDLLEGRGGLIWALLGAILLFSLLIAQGGNP
ncbi:MAG: hypothetical protein U5K99_03040 [Anaerolineales bacterium]|nr:hypothetical protein [Anaerolineales bacterium]